MAEGPYANERDDEQPGMSVGEVAALAGVSVRTLHHYDAIGILSPQRRSQAGYRLYGRAELERLQKILSYRELGFELDAIAQLLDDAGTDPAEHLRHQEALLTDRLERLLTMRRHLRKQMEATKMGLELTPSELFELFGENDPTKYAAEAEERWGNTDAYAQSQRRVKGYTKADWQRVQAETAAVEAQLVALLQAGVPASDDRALAAAEAHRQQISANYYDCTYEIHRGLALMYEGDPRFTAYYEAKAPGLATYLAAAIRANADQRVGPEGK